MRSNIYVSTFCKCEGDEETGASLIEAKPHPFNTSVKRSERWSYPHVVIIQDKYAHAFWSFYYDHSPYIPPLPVVEEVVEWRIK